MEPDILLLLLFVQIIWSILLLNSPVHYTRLLMEGYLSSMIIFAFSILPMMYIFSCIGLYSIFATLYIAWPIIASLIQLVAAIRDLILRTCVFGRGEC
jgi:hypothetical protein